MTRRRVAVVALCFALLFSTSKTLQLGAARSGGCTAAGHSARIGAARRALRRIHRPAMSPTRPSASTSKDGKLILESERMVPTTLTQNSPTEFGVPQTKMTLKFTLDAAGHGVTVVSIERSRGVFTSAPAIQFITSFTITSAPKSMIPMRDGIKLHTVILKPADIATPLPFLIQRTPYGCDGPAAHHSSAAAPNWRATDTSTSAETFAGASRAKAQFVMSRPQADHHDPKGRR